MKQQLIWASAAVACASVFSTQAQAAPANVWSGAYVGVTVGRTWMNQHSPTTSAAFTSGATNFSAITIPFDDHKGSWAGGGQLGYNWQSGNAVFGVEGDVIGRNLHGIVNSPAGTGTPFIPADTVEYQSKWEASLRGRLGYAWNTTMVYATGGVAFTDMRVAGVYPTTVSGGVTFPASAGSDQKTLTGATVGAGIEHKINEHLSVGAEYRYTWSQHAIFNLGSVAGASITPTTFTNTTISSNTRISHENNVMARVNYSF